MSAPAGLRGLAFAGPDGAFWGAAIGTDSPSLVLGAGPAGATLDGLRWSVADEGAWRLEGDDVQLVATPLAAAVAGAARCHVQGHAAGIAVDGPGVGIVLAPARSARQAPASARMVGGFFPDGSALGLLAGRPGRAGHQDEDAVAAALFDAAEETGRAVDDPRLSTTYDADGVPTRTNLELWIGEGEDEFLRRAAGEASGAGAATAVLRVVPLQCHSRGEEGAGVYALAAL
jgi:predicted NUDIX family NTP pyrophosphohydrolase